MRKILLAAVGIMALTAPAFADGAVTTTEKHGEDAITVEPGTAPTDAMTQEVPPMDEQSDDSHAATESMDDAVPPMQPSDEASTGQETDSTAN